MTNTNLLWKIISEPQTFRNFSRWSFLFKLNHNHQWSQFSYLSINITQNNTYKKQWFVLMISRRKTSKIMTQTHFKYQSSFYNTYHWRFRISKRKCFTRLLDTDTIYLWVKDIYEIEHQYVVNNLSQLDLKPLEDSKSFIEYSNIIQILMTTIQG